MRRVHLSMCTEGIKAVSKRVRCCLSVDGRNDTKMISVDANLFENGAKQLRLRLKTDQCGRGLFNNWTRSLSFLIKIVSTGRRNRTLSTKPVAKTVMLFTSAN